MFLIHGEHTLFLKFPEIVTNLDNTLDHKEESQPISLRRNSLVTIQCTSLESKVQGRNQNENSKQYFEQMKIQYGMSKLVKRS